MIGNSTIQLSSVCPASVSPSSSFIANSISSANFCLYLQSKPQKKRLLRARASSPPPSSDSLDSNNNPLSIALDVPRALWRQTLRPLSDFGFGRRSVWEGAVGLFIVSGTILLLLTVAWLRAFLVRSKLRKYLAVFEFSQASGICTGTPVRIRGVTVGNVIRVNPSLKNIEALVEVEDDKIIIPKNSLVEVNQSGLLMETQIDITPKNPIPSPSFGPLHANCIQEDLILCDRQKMQGYQGVSLDELVGIFTRIGRESELIGIANTYSLAERVSYVIIEARSLLTKMQTMAEDIEPLLSQVRHRSLLREVETLTKSLTLASEDLRRAQSSILTPENTELIRKSICTLIVTLENIENVSSDILGFTGDEATRRNLKLLIKSLSRLL